MSRAIALENPGLARPVQGYVVWWFVVVHALALLACVYGYFYGELRTFVLAVAEYFLCHLAITVIVHRYYAHPSYRAGAGWTLFWLTWFSGTFQGFANWWAATHRRHHAFSDTVWDPYSVRMGFWWAHMRWVWHASSGLHDAEVPVQLDVEDLANDWCLQFQQKYHWSLAIGIGLLLPTLVAYSWGDAAGGLLIAGFLRLCIQYHTTWCINSVAHHIGPWRYSRSITARTCYWVIGVTVGEWNHEGHHYAELDYRLGNRQWYDLDPGKWLIYLFSLVGVTWDLKRVSDKDLQSRISHLEKKAARAAMA